MSKLNKILLAVVIILLIILGVVIYWQKIGFEKPYWAVYLETGDLYFGKLNRFPRLSLSNVWFLQVNSQEVQSSLGVAKFGQAFWGPQDKIYLNEKNIIWKAKLRDDSQVLNFIKNQIPQSSTPTQE
jgi:hypothetical protein